MIRQRTLLSSIKTTGVGLHSGEPVHLEIHPAPVGHGIVFCRVDLPEPNCIAAKPQAVNDTRLSSTLVEGLVRVGTIEHLMSSFAALGLDNLLVKLDAPEIPIMDGSAAPFIFLMREAGIVEQEAPKQFVRIKKTTRVEQGDKWVQLDPYDGFKIDLTIDFDHPVFRRASQNIQLDFARTSFLDEISRARTFGFMHEVEFMREHGLGLGGSLDNAIVLDEKEILNNSGLRYGDEFVRHKLLDAIGDLYILGHPIVGAFSGHKSGHALNNQLLRQLLENPEAYEIVVFDRNTAPSAFHGLDSLQSV